MEGLSYTCEIATADPEDINLAEAHRLPEPLNDQILFRFETRNALQSARKNFCGICPIRQACNPKTKGNFLNTTELVANTEETIPNIREVFPIDN